MNNNSSAAACNIVVLAQMVASYRYNNLANYKKMLYKFFKVFTEIVDER